MRPVSLPPIRRRGISRGGRSSGRAGRAGRAGASATPTSAISPAAQAAAMRRLNATFPPGSAVPKTATAASAKPEYCAE